jgi:hypothetical protein
MHMIGYSCVLNGSEVHSWRGKPAYFEYRDGNGNLIFRFKGSRLKSSIRGIDGNAYQIVERNEIDRPTRYHSRGSDTSSFDGSKTVVDPNWTGISVANAKQQRKADIRRTVAEKLRDTDQDVLRALELSLSIPGPVATRRAALRQRAQQMMADIDALSTLAEIENYTEVNWPE